MPEKGALLSPYRVLDLTGDDGWLCGKILADLGADVVKVEPPGGDPARSKGPFYKDRADPEASLAWFAYNSNKRGITLDLSTTAGQDLLRRLAAKADFLLESFSPGHLDSLGIGYRNLRSTNPRLVVTSITPFGQTGPYAHCHGSDLIVTALSGFLLLVGEPGKPPVRISLPQSPMWTGMYAAAGSLIAHHFRQRTGRGQQVDVSMQASMLWTLANATSFWTLQRANLTRGGGRIVGRSLTGATMRAIYPCRDGQINFILYGGEAGKRSNEAMVEWMAEEGAAPEWLKEKDWGAFNIAKSNQEEIDAIEGPFSEFLARFTKAEFSEQAVKRGIMGYPVNHAKDIVDDPHLAARDYWQVVEHPELSIKLKYPGLFAKFGKCDHPIRRRAPHIGEHNAEIYCGEFGLAQPELAALQHARVI